MCDQDVRTRGQHGDRREVPDRVASHLREHRRCDRVAVQGSPRFQCNK
jgi:hypothetical protein